MKNFLFKISIVTAILGVIFLLLTGYFNSITPVGYDSLDVIQGICGFLFFVMAGIFVVTLVLGFIFKAKK